jgi:hypothetical protein
MRYLVTARVKVGYEAPLREAIAQGTLGEGSVAGDESLRNMAEARWFTDGSVKWVEVCFCNVPLEEERPYWEEYFDVVRVQDAHGRHRCRDLDGSEPWACCDCDCTERLEAHLKGKGRSFQEVLGESLDGGPALASSLAPPYTLTRPQRSDPTQS